MWHLGSDDFFPNFYQDFESNVVLMFPVIFGEKNLTAEWLASIGRNCRLTQAVQSWSCGSHE